MDQRWSALSSGAGDAHVGVGAIPTSKVELSISCRNLIDLDIVSKSDPQCFVFLKDCYQDRFYEIGRTEQISDNFNPDFVRKLTMDYNFEVVQKLRIEVWDIDPVGKEFLGQLETALGEIVSYKGRQFKKPLSGRIKGRNYGEIILVVEEMSSNKQVASMQFKGSGLKGGFFSSRNPFLTIWKSNEDGTYSVVYKTEMVRGAEAPNWKPFQCRLQTLCNGDMDRSIRFDCMNWKYTGDHKLIGSFFTTANKLVRGGAQDNTYMLTNPKRKNPNKNRGTIQLTNIVVAEEASFMDYLKGGLEMHFAVSIDFTASNGDVRDPRSLHYVEMATGRPTAYEIALRSIGQIISQYDSHGMFPGFGFGAKVPPDLANVSHQFPLNGNAAHPYCHGVDELIAHYRNCLTTVTLYGPTNFAPVINSTAAISATNQDGKNYFVLLIVTDGIICDMFETKHAIVKASTLPLSIIIVGVGNADFSAMDELDSDDRPLMVDGKRPCRDIVQFVPLNKHTNKQGNYVHSMIDLAREVLYEVPGQLTSYMKMKGFKPTKLPTDAPTAPPPAM